ncbi:MAG: hypothetical protein GXO62_01115 [Epsilonproteobacteria bacterium]|nr:hypothetical protein [Campylobacterota bacterium]
MGLDIKINGNVVESSGIIKTLSDAENLVKTIESITGDEINLVFKNSYGLPSSVIGALVKLEDSGKKINIQVDNDILYSILSDLNLIDTLNVSKL